MVWRRKTSIKSCPLLPLESESHCLKLLLDHNLPVHLKAVLTGHIVFTAREMGWDRLKNGALLSVAQEADFQVLLTGD